MYKLRSLLAAVAFTMLGFAQSDRGMITGTVAGRNDVSVEMQSFRKSLPKGVRVRVAQTCSVDTILQLGAACESISVTSEVALLTTGSAAVSTTINREQLNQLPLNFAIGRGAIRNPLSFTLLSPGASIDGWNNIKVNGAPASTFKIIFEGQRSRLPTTPPNSARSAAACSTSPPAPATTIFMARLRLLRQRNLQRRYLIHQSRRQSMGPPPRPPQ